MRGVHCWLRLRFHRWDRWRPLGASVSSPLRVWVRDCTRCRAWQETELP